MENTNVAIKDLNKINSGKHQVIYRKEQSIENHETGEIQERKNIVIAKEKNKAGFVKIFVDNIDYIVRLDNAEKILFFRVLKGLNYKNVFMFDKSFKKRIEDGKILSRTALYRAFKGLVEKEVLIKISDMENKEDIKYLVDDDISYLDDSYLANPDIVGKGSWSELETLRQTITLNFDFKNYEITKETTQEATYSGFNEISNNIDTHEVKQIASVVSDDGRHSETKIIIGEKDDYGAESEIIDIQSKNEEQQERSLFDEPTAKPEKITLINADNPSDITETFVNLSEKEIELALQNSKNKELELKNKQLELEIEKLKLMKNM